MMWGREVLEGRSWVWCLMVSDPCVCRGRGGVPPPPAGVPRGAPAPRGVPPSRGPVSRSRGLLAPRARGVPPPAGYRPLPPPPAQETYGEYVSGAVDVLCLEPVSFWRGQIPSELCAISVIST